MAAMVQTYSQQQQPSGNVAMLQSRAAAAAAAGMLPPVQPQPQPHQHHHSQSGQQFLAASQTPRAASANGMYRNPPSVMPPIQTHQVVFHHNQQPPPHMINQWPQPYPSPVGIPQFQNFDHHNLPLRSRPNMNASSYPAFGVVGYGASRDDSYLLPVRTVSSTSIPAAAAAPPRPQSAYLISNSPQTPTSQGSPSPSSGNKAPTPERYRRPNLTPRNSHSAPLAAAVDDLQVNMRTSSADDATRAPRRRSIHGLDYPPVSHRQELAQLAQPGVGGGRRQRIETLSPPQNQASRQNTLRLVTASGGRIVHDRKPSADSIGSNHSRSSSSAARTATLPTANTTFQQPISHPDDFPRHAPTSSSSASSPSPRTNPVSAAAPAVDAPKRTVTNNPSPLSKPAATESDLPVVVVAAAAGPGTTPPVTAQDYKSTTDLSATAAAAAATMATESPAAKRLAALNKDARPKSRTSRLRRAFSFGSAAEFRKVTGQDSADPDVRVATADSAAGETDSFDAEQERIARKQEEGGIGSSIYGRKLFSGSTDNLSVSSTASSASIMIRKMGRGVKRTSRSLAGLFRPKLAAGGAAGGEGSDSPPEAGQAAVSMVTVEADRSEGYAVAADFSARPPVDYLGSLSITSERTGSGVTESSRKSIVGGDRERAEALAAVRKGILKNTFSTSRRPADQSTDLPPLPGMTDSPASSAPSTPDDDAQGHKRTESVTIGNEDYFVAAMRLRQDTKSAPVSSPSTPHGSMKRSATFSPQIVFYDTWPSQEYDRRGDVATCNRLTPMLAQQIKEELNTFKMEMEVHENSKIYTHFF